MRKVKAEEIIKNVKEMCIEANLELAPDMKEALVSAKENETSEIGCKILSDLEENLEIAKNDQIPICQDTGMAVVFVEIGQDVKVKGSLAEAINEGVRQGYTEGYLRKSVVSDPLERVNTNDNTPAIIHYDIVDGDGLKITMM